MNKKSFISFKTLYFLVSLFVFSWLPLPARPPWHDPPDTTLRPDPPARPHKSRTGIPARPPGTTPGRAGGSCPGVVSGCRAGGEGATTPWHDPRHDPTRVGPGGRAGGSCRGVVPGSRAGLRRKKY